MKKKFIIPGFAVFVMLGISIASLNAVYAQTTDSYPPIVQKLAERFNLNPADIQSVFEDERDERQAEMYAKFEDRLDELLTAGKITADQKQTILDKHEEMRAAMEDSKNLSPDERYQKMKQIHEDFKTWAEENGINLDEIRFMLRGPGGGFKGDHMMRAIN